MLWSKSMWLLIYLQRIEVDMFRWGEGLETITPRRLNEFLAPLRKALALAGEDTDAALKIQGIIDQLESIQASLSRSAQKIDQNLAQKIANEIHELRRERTSELQPVTAIDEIVGAYVVYPNGSSPTIGQVVRFRSANSERRYFGELGEVVLRPADEQAAMVKLFQEIYFFGNHSPFLSAFYHWPADLPQQTFEEPGRPKDLLTVTWSSGRKEKKSLKKRAGDSRIGMSAYYEFEQVRGELIAIEAHEDGETWTINAVERGQISDESLWFWLEIEEFSELFPPRTIAENDIAQKLLEALQIYRIEIYDFDEIPVHDRDESIERHQRLESLLKFLNGDIEDDHLNKAIKELYETFYKNVVHGTTSSKYEENAHRTAARIARLRRNDG